MPTQRRKSQSKLEELLRELREIQETARLSRPFNEVIVDVLSAMVEASQLQTQQTAQLLASYQRQTNIFSEFRKLLTDERDGIG